MSTNLPNLGITLPAETDPATANLRAAAIKADVEIEYAVKAVRRHALGLTRLLDLLLPAVDEAIEYGTAGQPPAVLIPVGGVAALVDQHISQVGHLREGGRILARLALDTIPGAAVLDTPQA